MKCISLFSGGLDSMLAIKLMKEQGIDIHAINIDIGFGGDLEKFKTMERRAKMAGASFEVINVRSKYLQEVLFSPKFGYGKQFNPCIDCHGFMFKTALSMLKDYGANFIITGEVVGQRPMSQRSQALKLVKNLAKDDENLILRPLCAKNLEPTKPEILGWVDREKLLDISGRGRSKQIELATKFGFSDWESPAGGCPYTMESFSNRIRDFMKFNEKMEEEDLQILRFGRHLRLPNGAKMVIGRDESDNNNIKNIKNQKMAEVKTGLVGAYSLVDISANLEDLELAASLALTYSKHNGEVYEVQILDKKFKTKALASKSEANKFFVN